MAVEFLHSKHLSRQGVQVKALREGLRWQWVQMLRRRQVRQSQRTRGTVTPLIKVWPLWSDLLFIRLQLLFVWLYKVSQIFFFNMNNCSTEDTPALSRRRESFLWQNVSPNSGQRRLHKVIFWGTNKSENAKCHTSQTPFCILAIISLTFLSVIY